MDKLTITPIQTGAFTEGLPVNRRFNRVGVVLIGLLFLLVLVVLDVVLVERTGRFFWKRVIFIWN